MASISTSPDVVIVFWAKKYQGNAILQSKQNALVVIVNLVSFQHHVTH